MRLLKGRKLARRISIALAVVLLTHMLLVNSLIKPAQAFFPTTLRTVGGLFGKSHTKITSDAIEDLDLEFFGITDLTKPMKKAIEEISDANAEVDDDAPKSAPHHFDGESLPEGQNRLVTLLQSVKTALNNDDVAGARSSLGQALHTLQDFYSHSNWVEYQPFVNPSLGRVGFPFTRLPKTFGTCTTCSGGLPPLVCPDCSENVTTTSLTSGYYGGQDSPFNIKPSGKCSHGGLTDSGADGFFGEGINKDSLDCEFSPHNFLHTLAAELAVGATRQFIRDIKDMVTPRQIKQLLGVGPTLAIAIDTTGSMGGIISSVKQQAIQIVNSRLGTDEEPAKYVLAPFNDPGVGPTTVTRDADTFKNAISALVASGGGDCPELSQTGMLQALSASDKGGDLFMFTDASSKDASLAGNVSSLAVSKNIKVFPILFGSCSPIDPSYRRVANESGGQLFFLSPAEAGNITRLADFIVRSNAVDLLSIADTLSGSKTFTIPVDSTMTRITFSASETSSIVVKRPGGATVQLTDPDVSAASLSSGTVLSISAPATGSWSVTVTASTTFSLNVSGEGKLDLSSFRFVEPRGRTGHQGMFPIAGLPLAGQTNTVDAVVSGAFNTAQFEFRSKAGAVVQSLSLSQGAGEFPGEFSGQVTLPDVPFLVYVTGADGSGATYQRVLPTMFTPQRVKITAPPSQDLRPGQTTTYTFQVKNLGPANTFNFTAVDDKGFVSSVNPITFTLNTNETMDVMVQLQPPSNAVASTDTLTARVESVGANPTSNFAVVTSTVIVGPVFDMSVQDNTNGKLLLLNSMTGDYQFFDCRKGFSMAGKGITTINFCKIELRDSGPVPKSPDRNVYVLVNSCTHAGNATVEVFSSGITHSLADADITNNNATCP